MPIIRFALYWAVWGALVGAVSALAITVAIIWITRPPLFSIDNYWLAGMIGSLVGAPIAVIGGFVQAWRQNSE